MNGIVICLIGMPCIFLLMIVAAIATAVTSTDGYKQKMAELEEKKKARKPKVKPVVVPVKDEDLPPLSTEVHKRMKAELNKAKFNYNCGINHWQTFRWNSKAEKDDFLRKTNKKYEDAKVAIFSKWYEKMTPEEYYNGEKTPVWLGYFIFIIAGLAVITIISGGFDVLIAPFAFIFAGPLGTIWGYVATSHNAKIRKELGIDNIEYRLKDAQNLTALTIIGASSAKAIKGMGESFKPQKNPL